MSKWIRRVVLVALVVAGLTGTANAAQADEWCAGVGAWEPVGRQTVCLPLP